MKSKVIYTPLHTHTNFSMLDSIIRIPELIDKLKANNMPSCGISDHGNMYGALKFYNACKDAEIRAILGFESYICDDIKKKEDRKFYHLVLFAKNYEGYLNLIKLITISNLEGFYYKPRLDIETIAKYSKGILATSACLQGKVQRLLLDGKASEARDTVAKYKDIFWDDFYIELMRHGLEDQVALEPELIKLARETKTKLIATCDAHYLNRDDAFAQEVSLAIGMNQKISTPPRTKDNPSGRFVFGADEFYVRTPEEMGSLFKDIPEALKNTNEVAEKCNLVIPFRGIKVTKYKLPEGTTDSFEYLKKLCRAGWKKYKLDKGKDKRYTDRIKYELDIINQTKLSDYFLTVADICKYADDNKIGRDMGRGSAGASLIAYLMNITKVDPIEYGLIFERFYNKGRGEITMENGEYYINGSPPDIDVDVSWLRRDEILDYISTKWPNSCQIITFNTMSAKAAIKDVARVLGFDFALSNHITSFVPKTPGITIDEAVEESTKLKEYQNEYKKLFTIARRLEGCTRNASVHAAGVIISSEALDKQIPLVWDSKSKCGISSFDMGDCELSGLQKIDVLGLRTIDQVDMTIKLANERGTK